GLAGDVGGVEQIALGIERRLGGVQIFRLLVAEGAASERDHARLQIADREQQAVPKPIVRAAAVFSRHGQASRDERVLADLLRLHEIGQPVPAVGRIAEAEAFGDLRVDPAFGEILLRPLTGRLPQRFRVELHGQIHHAEELFAPRIAGLPAALFWQGDAGRLGERADRFGERQPILAHEKAEDVAADSTSEAVENALLGIHHERGRLLAVERTEPLPVRTGLAEVHEASDEVHDVYTRPDVVEDGRRVGGHRQLTFSAATVAPAPPSDGSPSRNDSTSGWLDSSVRTALRKAPVPLPCTRRTFGRPAMKASSRYCSTRSRASSVVLPSSMSSGPIARPDVSSPL